MRRWIASVALLLTVGMFLAPAAVASLVTRQEPTHACCRRAHHHGEDCDHGATAPQNAPQGVDKQLLGSKQCCSRCGVAALTARSARPNHSQIIETPHQQHAFAQEFYPQSAPQQDTETQSSRAPPAPKTR